MPKSASTKEIKAAYYRLAQTWHPDKNKSESARAKFAEIKKAHDVLININLRQKYDESGCKEEPAEEDEEESEIN